MQSADDRLHSIYLKLKYKLIENIIIIIIKIEYELTKNMTTQGNKFYAWKKAQRRMDTEVRARRRNGKKLTTQNLLSAIKSQVITSEEADHASWPYSHRT